jgi:hypothetical protein
LEGRRVKKVEDRMKERKVVKLKEKTKCNKDWQRYKE